MIQRIFRPIFAIFLAATLSALVGCTTEQFQSLFWNPFQSSTPKPSAIVSSARIQPLQLDEIASPILPDQSIALTAAKNEWISYTLEITNLPPTAQVQNLSLKLQPLRLITGQESISPDQFTAYQIVSMPVDLNRADYVRQTGRPGINRRMPRALLPLPNTNGQISLSTANNSSASLQIWVDIHIPLQARPGEYTANCELTQAGIGHSLGSIPLKLTVHDIALPDERHLLMTSPIQWDALKRLYPEQFEGLIPYLLNRRDIRYAPAIQTLDCLVKLAHRNRLDVFIPRLQPLVKWPSNQPPLVDWADFDSVVRPWLDGTAFTDRQKVGYWPLPNVDYLDQYDLASRADYWSAAADHFEIAGWLKQSSALLQENGADPSSRSQLFTEADVILQANPQAKVTLPIREDEIDLIDAAHSHGIHRGWMNRVIAAGSGLTSTVAKRPWPAWVDRPAQWLRTDLTATASVSVDEREVRRWAWLAFLRQSEAILWEGALPVRMNLVQPAEANELTWFYPGNWFGLDTPVETVQLKWLRRAQQDYEYLYLARQRGQAETALTMTRLLAKPVEVDASRQVDPIHPLLGGTTEPNDWAEAMQLLTQTILLNAPGRNANADEQQDLKLQMMRWTQPQERPVLLTRSSQWSLAKSNSPSGNWVNLQVGMDIYCPLVNMPAQSTILWRSMPIAWQMPSQPVAVPKMSAYQVKQMTMNAKLDLNQIGPQTRLPLELRFTNGFTRQIVPTEVMLPVAASVQREKPVTIDGSLDDWSSQDAIQDGPMVRMLNRPALRRDSLEYATTPTSLYTAWTPEEFQVAFKVGGRSTVEIRSTRNFVEYQSRRAWGEDLCQILIQPIYADNSTGPTLHIVCKPTGQWVERKTGQQWEPISGTGLRYAATIASDLWRGEVAIPWQLIADPTQKRPVLLRFNFAQHQTTTGESASWSGPVDFGRDDSLMGLLQIRQKD